MPPAMPVSVGIAQPGEHGRDHDRHDPISVASAPVGAGGASPAAPAAAAPRPATRRAAPRRTHAARDRRAAVNRLERAQRPAATTIASVRPTTTSATSAGGPGPAGQERRGGGGRPRSRAQRRRPPARRRRRGSRGRPACARSGTKSALIGAPRINRAQLAALGGQITTERSSGSTMPSRRAPRSAASGSASVAARSRSSLVLGLQLGELGALGARVAPGVDEVDDRVHVEDEDREQDEDQRDPAEPLPVHARTRDGRGRAPPRCDSVRA